VRGSGAGDKVSSGTPGLAVSGVMSWIFIVTGFNETVSTGGWTGLLGGGGSPVSTLRLVGACVTPPETPLRKAGLGVGSPGGYLDAS